MNCRDTQQMVMPYIKEELDFETTRQFLNHVQECPECEEELEIYFTIHRALEQLDNEREEHYDIHKLMDENIRQTDQRIRMILALRFGRRLINIVAAAALAACIIVQIYL